MVLIPNTNFVVDGFKYSSTLDKPYYIFFLTHMHADHWTGLTPSWNRGPIYCSHITARMLTHKFPGISNVTPLELDEPHFIYMDQNQTTGVNVTFIDANHIPGAVMILFQSPSLGNILHTGDFRYKPSLLNHSSLRDSSNRLISIDHLFLDNTFGKEDFNFPPAEQCTADFIEIIQDHPDSDVWISNDALGKEELLLTLAKYFKTLVVVSQVRYRDIEMMGYDASWFTTNPEDGWIHCISKEEMKKIGNRNREGTSTIGFYMSGWFKVKAQKGPYLYKELMEFVREIKPRKLTCLVSESSKFSGIFGLMEHATLEASKPAIREEEEMKSGVNLQERLKRKLLNSGSSSLHKAKKPKVLGSRIV